MGDVAEMMLDGTLCESCGQYLGEAVGYPRRGVCCGHLSSSLARSSTKEEAIITAQFDLHSAGLTWVTNNNGIHLQIYRGKERVADFWPTTNKWTLRTKKRKGYGVEKLINELKD